MREIDYENFEVTPDGDLSSKVEFVLSRKQRDSILKRDGGKCRATVPHEHDIIHSLEVDHIIPQRYAVAIGLPNPDIPENLLTKCRTAHDLKHTDRIGARQTYHQAESMGFNTFQELFESRVTKLESG